MQKFNTMQLNIFKVCLILMITTCNLAFSIIQGNSARYAQFPWHVYLEVKKGLTGQYYCGGSLISSKWILTLGYCLYGATHIVAHLGSTNRNYSPLRLITTTYKIHPNFTKTLESDVGLVNVKISLGVMYTIKPITLAKRFMTEEYLIGKIAKVCGFGRYDVSIKHAEEYLRFQTVQIISKGICSQLLKDLPNSSFCAFPVNIKQSTCFGDGGGGLVLNEDEKHYLIGVYSFQSNLCVGRPGGYQLVQEHLKWISEVTKIAV